MHLREIFYGTLIFQQSSMINFVLATMLEGTLLPFNMVAKTTFCLYLDVWKTEWQIVRIV